MHTLNNTVMLLSLVMYILLICITVAIPNKYRQFIHYTDEYINCEEDAAEMKSASDFLTEQSRLCVQNRDIENMKLYFEEINNFRRREQAFAKVKEYNLESNVQESMYQALKCSDELMGQEIYAMKLISEAENFNKADIPEEVLSTQLSPEDAALTPEEMVDKAREMVFGVSYQSSKKTIDDHITRFSEGLLNHIEHHQDVSLAEIKRTLFNQRICIAILVIINFLFFASIIFLVIKPMEKHINDLRENRMLDMKGAYEIKYMAQTYNGVYERNAKHEALLVKKTMHDSLTGLLNRGAFETLKTKLSSEAVALILFDIDYFKQVNDAYGHEIGDDVLRFAAGVLSKSFRSSDYVIRLGGDEFVVVLTDINIDNKNVVERKFENINKALENENKDLPPVSFSAGAAFSECGFTEDLYMKADNVLYKAKNSGRKNICFFSENEMTDVMS